MHGPSGDRAPAELVAFYKSYRACVRAKVALLRARQLPAPSAQEQLALAGEYLDLADQFDQRLGPPVLLLVRGLSGTGKSTIAQGLADRLGIELRQTDAVRQELSSSGKLPADPQSDKYSTANRQQVYDQLLLSAEQLLDGHSSIILDGTFLSHQNIGGSLSWPSNSRRSWLIVHCECPVGIAQERVAARRQSGRSLSEARPELVEEQIATQESDRPEWPVMRCDTTRPVPALVQEIVERLR